MGIPEKCDVAVLGGGPAGSTAATFLRRKGYHVVLLDKSRHPRRVVGESLLPHVWKFTDILGVSEKIESDGFVRKNGGIVDWEGTIRRLKFSDFGYTRPAMHVERERLDKILLDHALSEGVEVFEEVSAFDVVFKGAGNGAIVSHRAADGGKGKLACSYVVDASGSRSFLARQMDLRVPDPEFRFMAIWGYFKGHNYLSAEGVVEPYSRIHEAPPVTFVNSLGDWAWSWCIPMREEVSVGMLVPIDRIKKPGLSGTAQLTEYFLQTCEQHPNLSRVLDREQFITDSLNVLQSYSFLSKEVSGDGFFIAGDATGFVDPIYSNGVTSAFYSGYLAAWAIDRSLRKKESAQVYQSIYSRQILGHLRLLRDLALPDWIPKESPEVLRKLLWSQNETERALMFAVALVAGRADNVYRIYDKASLNKALAGRIDEIKLV